MISGRIITLVCVCGSAVLLLGAARQDESPEVTEGLLSKDPAQVNQARDELISARRDLIRQLKHIIEDPNNRAYKRSSVRAAMVILGEMRALEAINLLVEHIGWPKLHKPGEPFFPVAINGGDMVTTLPSYRRWPAVDALVRIGEPSVDPVFRKLVDIRPEPELKAYLSVLIWLRDREYILSRLNQLLSQATDPDQRVLLEHAVRLVTDAPPVNPRSPEYRRR
jgi:hypothetical protein